MASIIAPGESSSHRYQWKYDVFLSFRGKDTRKNFTSFLYDALYRKGIVTYRDDPSLKKGQNISNELLKAIENSKCLVVIISEDYASSTWCLDELAKIVECVKEGEQLTIPIFYNVDPSHMRKQKGSFERAFVKHEETFKDNMDKVHRWRNAIKEIATLAGWNSRDRQYDSHLIQDIVEDLQNKLARNLLYAPKNLVGMESRMEDMFLQLSLGSDDVRIVGISGMGGIGKSTLARVVFDKISAQFDGCSFLADIKKVSTILGLWHFQNKLLFDMIQEKDLIKDLHMGAHMIEGRLNAKKVLVVLDDVDDTDQIDYLAKKSWFGCGSRIIITTRDEHLLRDADVVHKAKELSNKEAQELFFSKALGENNITKEFENLSKQFIEYAKGLPLALTVLGCSLRGRSMNQWQNALDRLWKNPNKEIFETLRSGFDRLEETEQAIFLDIACFFNGKDKNYVMEILDCCGFYPEIGVERLLEKSFLTILDNKIMVHDLLQEMAWEVVKQESPKEPGKRSRLRFPNDLNHVMATNTGTESIEGIVLDQNIPGVNWNADCFTKMTNLRLLDDNETDLGGFIFGRRECLSELKYLSNELRLLKLYGFPSSCLPASFLPESIYELSLRCNGLTQLWTGQKIFWMLKLIDLSYSCHLKETPDFKLFPNLEKLTLGGCRKLSRIHPSIGVLHKLKFLDLSGCESLRRLPPSIGNLRSLEVLHLGGCSDLKELPDSIWSLECLEELHIGETAIAHLPTNLTNLKNLKVLSCCGCEGMWSDLPSLLFRKPPIARGMLLPPLSGLSSLEELDISGCHLQEGGIPNDLGCLSSLRELNLSSNHFFTIPECISQLPQLESLNLNYCRNLQALPRLPDSILFVGVASCIKLNSISNLFMICTASGRISLFNCLKLLPGDLEIPLEKKNSLALLCYIIGCLAFPHQFGKTYVVAPNCEIPNWFASQKVGYLFSFRIRDRGFVSKGSGFAICVSFLGQEQECNDSEHVECSYDLICEFNVGGNQLGPSFHFPIRFITSNSLWMGFVPLKCFGNDTAWEERTGEHIGIGNDTKWEEIIDERIDVSLWTVRDKLKITKCGILPLQQQRPHAIRKIIRSACSSPEDISSIFFHELKYQEVDYDFCSSVDKEEREDHSEIPRYARLWGAHRPAAVQCGFGSGSGSGDDYVENSAISYVRAWF